jgi:hypothetical protein
MAKRFEEFLEAVRDSVEAQAKRKNYSDNGVSGVNKLMEVGRLLNYEPQHGIGEIIYKCSEYLTNPREVLLVKIAGWAGVLWMRHHEEQEAKWCCDGKGFHTADCRYSQPDYASTGIPSK